MSNVLSARLKRLEVVAGINTKAAPKVVRLVSRHEEETEVYRMAEEMGLDTSPDSNDILIIRLIAVPPARAVETLDYRELKS